MKRVAIFRALQLGDLLVAVPAFRALRQRFPDAEITLMSLPWAASFVRRFNCYIDRFVEFVGYPGIDEVPFDAQRTERFLVQQRAYGYDLILQMHGSGRTSNPFVLALGAPTTVGYYEKKVDGLTIGALYPNDQHEIYRNLNLVALLERIDISSVGTDLSQYCSNTKTDPYRVTTDAHKGLPYYTTRSSSYSREAPCGRPLVSPPIRLPLFEQYCDVSRPRRQLTGQEDAIHRSLQMDTRLEFPLFADDYAEADALLRSLQQDGKRIIGIHPGARPPARRWPTPYFATVADALAQCLNAQILLTGGPGEEQTVQAVSDAMHLPAISLAGKTSLGSLAALISRCDLFISNDTGPSHIACAVDCPSITIFGPADVRRWAPLNRQRHPIVRHPVACSPCGYWECPIDHRCLRWLSPEVVIMAAIDTILSLKK